MLNARSYVSCDIDVKSECINTDRSKRHTKLGSSRAIRASSMGSRRDSAAKPVRRGRANELLVGDRLLAARGPISV